MPKPKKYIVHKEGNDQELIVAITDKEAMTKALQKHGIMLLRFDDTGNFKHKKIT